MDYTWFVDQLVAEEQIEDGPELTKEECADVLKQVSDRIGGAHLLIVNVNIERDRIYYDYIMSEATENSVRIAEWDNRYL